MDEERHVVDVNYVIPGQSPRVMAVYAGVSWRRHAESASAELGVDVEEAWRVLMLSQAAARHDLDALVLESPILKCPKWRSHAQGAHLTTADQAIELTGLYLRAHQDFVIDRPEGKYWQQIGFGRFYRTAALATLPPFSDWMHAAVTAWRDRGEARPYRLLTGIESRMGRALRARDYFNVRIRHWRPDEAWDEALYFFESALLLLSGALMSSRSAAMSSTACAVLINTPGSTGSRGERRSPAWRQNSVPVWTMGAS